MSPSGPFAKVYRSLWDGTLAARADAWPTFLFLLAHSDAEGIVDMTCEAISARSGFTLEVVRAAIAALEAPDPGSRSPAENGSRIVRLDAHRTWGWRIVNHQRYRARGDVDRSRAYRQRNAEQVRARDRQRKRRARRGGRS